MTPRINYFLYSMSPLHEPQKHILSALGGFIDFIKKQNVVGLAVGIILGSSAKGVVDALVADILNPFIGLLLGGVDLADQNLCLNMVDGICKSKLAWGHFATVLLQFFIVAAVVYFVIEKAMKFFLREEK